MDLKESDLLGDEVEHHWYYKAKGAAVRSILGNLRARDVLDVGAGSGFFSKDLIRHGVCEHAVCVDPHYQQERVEQFETGTISFRRTLGRTEQNLILMMDVIEHVDDDVGLIKDYTDTMPAGGHVLISVPAFQLLWSGHDEFLEHRRRYTLNQVEQCVRACGLDVILGRYYFAALFPVVAASRMLSRSFGADAGHEPQSAMKSYPNWMNATLTAIHLAELQTLFSVNRLAGLTVFCLARKPVG